MKPLVRTVLPKPRDRLKLGHAGLQVSPLCLGIVGEPELIPAAFDAGINFFFLTADLHWPLYEQLRRGLELLFERPGVRDQVVVGVVSYLGQPLFGALQFHEVIHSVKGLERVDILLAGAVPDATDFNARYESIIQARAHNHSGARAIGASFHHRPSALASMNINCLDIAYIRYNTSHAGAAHDIFPYLRPDHHALIYNFKSLFSYVSPEAFAAFGLSEDTHWLPKPTDYYRYVLSRPQFDGILCSPHGMDHLEQLIAALDDAPLTIQQEHYMRWLSEQINPRYF